MRVLYQPSCGAPTRAGGCCRRSQPCDVRREMQAQWCQSCPSPFRTLGRLPLGSTVLCHAGFSSEGSSGMDEPGRGGGGFDAWAFDLAVLSNRMREVRLEESAECERNWREGRCTHHTVAALDVWVRKLCLHGESVACGTHVGECYVIDGLCGRGTSSNLYPDEDTDMPLTTARRLRRCVGLEAEITSLDFTGSALLAGAKDGSMRLWMLKGDDLAGPGKGEPGQGLRELAGTPENSTSFAGHRARVTGCQLAHDGRLVVSSSLDGMVSVWNASSGKHKHSIRVGTSVTCMQCTDDYILAGLGDGQVVALSLPRSESAKPKVVLSFSAHTSPVTCLQYFHDEHFHQDVLVTGSHDGVLRTWDFDNGGNCLQEFVGHKAAVVDLHCNTTRLLSASKDGSVRCWDFRSGKSWFGIWGHTAYIGSVACDESRLVSDGTNNVIGIHDFGPGAPTPDHELDL